MFAKLAKSLPLRPAFGCAVAIAAGAADAGAAEEVAAAAVPLPAAAAAAAETSASHGPVAWVELETQPLPAVQTMAVKQQGCCTVRALQHPVVPYRQAAAAAADNAEGEGGGDRGRGSEGGRECGIGVAIVSGVRTPSVARQRKTGMTTERRRVASGTSAI